MATTKAKTTAKTSSTGYLPIAFIVQGTESTLMSNGRMVDKLNPYTKALKTMTSKMKRSDEEELDMRKLQFLGSLYMRDDVETENEKTPYWPRDNVKTLVWKASKTQKCGPKVLQGLIAHDAILEYDGPKDAEGLWADTRFRHVKRAVRERKSVMVCRPQFREWKTVLALEYDPQKINRDDLVSFVEHAGRYIGLSTWQMRYGMFQILEVVEGKDAAKLIEKAK